MKQPYIVVSLLLLFVGGCKEQNPNYCPNAPLENCLNEIDAATACTSNASCMAPAGVCDVEGTKTCVECTAKDAAACVGAEPVCGTDHACRKCEAHSECASQVCLPDGSCAASVAYVDGAAPAANVACTLAAKCNTITKALAAGKPIVKVEGTVDDRVTIQNKNVQLFGASGAKLTSSSNGAIVTVGGTSVVAIFDLTIADASGTGAGFGAQVQTGATGSLSIVRSRVVGSREAGISSSGGLLVLSRSLVAGNKGGGVYVSGGAFKITNSVIAENGDPSVTGSSLGGVALDSVSANNMFDDNTVVGNRVRAASADTPGVKCAVANFVARRNIVTSNAQDTTYPAQVQGGCTFEQSLVEPGSSANALKFADPSQLNYHLTAASPASVRDVPGVTTCSGVDLDGDARPQNGLCDLGADEFKP